MVGRRQETIPTSGDVHLYRDVILNDAEKDRPLLYADCEGFHGGSQEPTARAHTWSLTDHGISQGLAEITKWAKLGLGYISSGFKRPLTAAAKREDAGREVFPKLLYNFSDIIIDIMNSQAYLTLVLSQPSTGQTLRWSCANTGAS